MRRLRLLPLLALCPAAVWGPVAMISGEGGNIGVLTGPEGTLLVDAHHHTDGSATFVKASATIKAFQIVSPPGLPEAPGPSWQIQPLTG